jgi:chemotaxis protein MotA
VNSASLIGILLGFTAVVGGNLIEGGRIGSIVQGSAAIIVFGGTMGATFLSFSMRDIVLAFRMLRHVFFEDVVVPREHSVINDLVDYAQKARKNGILSLENEVNGIGYSFMRRAMRLLVDGVDPVLIQSSLEQDIRTFEEERTRGARVFEAAGGFAPTIGIIGAVLGLIHVMENLSDPTKLGSGIAVAFVATVYGVASANLIFLPVAKKMLNSTREEVNLRELITEGVMGIQAGRNPYYIKEHLLSFMKGRH